VPFVTLTKPRSDNSMYPNANVHADHTLTSTLIQQQSLASRRRRRCQLRNHLVRTFLLLLVRAHLGFVEPQVVGTYTRLVLRVCSGYLLIVWSQELQLLRDALLAAEVGAQLAFLGAGGHSLFESVSQEFAVQFLSLFLLFLTARGTPFGFAGRQGRRPCSEPHNQGWRTSHGRAVWVWRTQSFVGHR
jgi:hypothetical protein